MKPRKPKRLPDRQSKLPSLEITTDSISAELQQLGGESIAILRTRYKFLLREDPPEAFGPDLLRRSIAGTIQEKHYGGLSQQAERLLSQLMKGASTKPNGPLELPRQIKPGSELIREWKGKTYRVVVKPDGFAYGSKAYASLSEIASLITGTNWNGPRFFGLRAKVEGAPANGK